MRGEEGKRGVSTGPQRLGLGHELAGFDSSTPACKGCNLRGLEPGRRAGTTRHHTHSAQSTPGGADAASGPTRRGRCAAACNACSPWQHWSEDKVVAGANSDNFVHIGVNHLWRQYRGSAVVRSGSARYWAGCAVLGGALWLRELHAMLTADKLRLLVMLLGQATPLTAGKRFSDPTPKCPHTAETQQQPPPRCTPSSGSVRPSRCPAPAPLAWWPAGAACPPPPCQPSCQRLWWWAAS